MVQKTRNINKPCLTPPDSPNVNKPCLTPPDFLRISAGLDRRETENAARRDRESRSSLGQGGLLKKGPPRLRDS